MRAAVCVLSVCSSGSWPPDAEEELLSPTMDAARGVILVTGVGSAPGTARGPRAPHAPARQRARVAVMSLAFQPAFGAVPSKAS